MTRCRNAQFHFNTFIFLITTASILRYCYRMIYFIVIIVVCRYVLGQQFLILNEHLFCCSHSNDISVTLQRNVLQAFLLLRLLFLYVVAPANCFLVFV